MLRKIHSKIMLFGMMSDAQEAEARAYSRKITAQIRDNQARVAATVWKDELAHGALVLPKS